MPRFKPNATQIKAVKQVMDDIITYEGKLCKLFYMPTYIDCTNCNLPAVSTYSGNIWTHGGPKRSDQNGCVFCGGSGKIAEEHTEEITLTIDWKPSKFTKIVNVAKEFSVISTRGYLYDLPKIQKCIKIQVALPVAGYVIAEYKLNGEGFDPFNIVPNRYFVAFWDRI